MMKAFHELDSRSVAIVREFLYNDKDARECVRRLVTLWASQNAWGLKNVTQETRTAVVDRLIADNFEAKLREAVPQHKVNVFFLGLFEKNRNVITKKIFDKTTKDFAIIYRYHTL